MQELKIIRLQGNKIHNVIDALAQLRLTVFKEYPYLYDGNMEYEKEYLQTYIDCEDSVFIAVYDGDEVVGASTAIPLIYETPACQKSFIENQLPLSQIFYFGESVLLPQYRNQGIYKHFFKEREDAARNHGCSLAAFCAVVRDESDSRRPLDYQPLDEIWKHFGYQKMPSMHAYYEWKELDQLERSTKPLVFWMKTL